MTDQQGGRPLDTPPASIRSRRVRPSIRRLALWLGPLLLMTLAWQVWDRLEAARLDRQLSRVIAIAPTPAATTGPVGLEAGRYYLAADFLARRVDGVSGQALGRLRDAASRGQRAPDDALAVAATFTHQNDAALQMLDRAKNIPVIRLDPHHAYMAGSMGFWSLEHVAALRTIEQVAMGDGDGAASSLLGRIRLLRMLSTEQSTFYASLKTAALSNIATDISLAIGRSAVSDARLVELEDSFASVHTPDEFLAVIRGEALRTHEAGSSFWGRDAIVRFRPMFRFSTTLVLRPAFRRHAASMLHIAEDAAEAGRRPWPDRIQAMKNLRARDPAIQLPLVGKPSYLAQEYAGFAVDYARGLAAARCARAAIGVERYRREHRGRLPDRLEDLATGQGDERLVDPFTGAPLKYVVAGSAYTIYSAGPDGRDDGGQVERPQAAGSRGANRSAPADFGLTVAIR